MTDTLALHVIDRPPIAPACAGWDDRRTVVLVHGSLDRADSFRRVMRRLPEFRVIAYDRRGYQGSRALGAGTFSEHVSDLLGLLAALGGPDACHLVVGHSLGGAVALGAALARPPHLAGVAAFEPPRCFGSPLATRQTPALGEANGRTSTPEQTVVRFFSAIGGPAAWKGLPQRAQLERLADGPALDADLRSAESDLGLDPRALGAPAVFGRGTAGSPRHRASAGWLADHVPGSMLYEIDGAGHGAHLSHPDAFARFVLAAWDHSLAGNEA